MLGLAKLVAILMVDIVKVFLISNFSSKSSGIVLGSGLLSPSSHTCDLSPWLEKNKN
jgi:hypothetical protein